MSSRENRVRGAHCVADSTCAVSLSGFAPTAAQLAPSADCPTSASGAARRKVWNAPTRGEATAVVPPQLNQRAGHPPSPFTIVDCREEPPSPHGSHMARIPLRATSPQRSMCRETFRCARTRFRHTSDRHLRAALNSPGNSRRCRMFFTLPRICAAPMVRRRVADVGPPKPNLWILWSTEARVRGMTPTVAEKVVDGRASIPTPGSPPSLRRPGAGISQDPRAERMPTAVSAPGSVLEKPPHH